MYPSHLRPLAFGKIMNIKDILLYLKTALCCLVFKAIWCSSLPLMSSSFVSGGEGDYLQRTRPQLLRRTTWREGGTSNCVSPAVHGSQVGGAGPGEGGSGGRDLLLPLLLLLLCGCWHALAMTQAHHCSGPYISFYSSFSKNIFSASGFHRHHLINRN